MLVCFPAEAPVDNELHPDYVPSQNLELADHGEIDDGRKRLERFKRAVRREKEREESDSSVNDEVEVSEEEEESSVDVSCQVEMKGIKIYCLNFCSYLNECKTYLIHPPVAIGVIYIPMYSVHL